eukprot:g38744.t1
MILWSYFSCCVSSESTAALPFYATFSRTARTVLRHNHPFPFRSSIMGVFGTPGFKRPGGKPWELPDHKDATLLGSYEWKTPALPEIKWNTWTCPNCEHNFRKPEMLLIICPQCDTQL